MSNMAIREYHSVSWFKKCSLVCFDCQSNTVRDVKKVVRSNEEHVKEKKPLGPR